MVRLDLLLAALSHPTRRAAMRVLRRQGELCLCELMSQLTVGQSTMSRHMATLKGANLVADRRDAQWVRYRLNPIDDAGMALIACAVLDIEDDQAADSGERSAA